MEHKSEKINAIISNNPNSIIDHEPKPTPQPSFKKKKHSSKNIFKVALFMMRGGHRKSKMLPMDEGSRSMWRKLVGSMRPLHLQSNHPPMQIPQPNVKITLPSENTTNDHREWEGFDSASEFLNSPSPRSSRYASAVGLNEMVQDEENQKEEEIAMVEDDGDGDELIDAKAEEFIAQFYREMK